MEENILYISREFKQCCLLIIPQLMLCITNVFNNMQIV